MLTSSTLPKADTLSVEISPKEMALLHCPHEVLSISQLVSFGHRSLLALLMFERLADCQGRSIYILQEFRLFSERLQIEKRLDPLIFSSCSLSEVSSVLAATQPS